MKCSIKKQTLGSTPSIKVCGSVSGEDAVRLSEELGSLHKQGVSKFLIDLSEATGLDSSAMGVLVYWWKLLKQEHKQLILYRPHEIISEMLETTNLDKLLPVVTTVDNLDV